MLVEADWVEELTCPATWARRSPISKFFQDAVGFLSTNWTYRFAPRGTACARKAGEAGGCTGLVYRTLLWKVQLGGSGEELKWRG